MSIFPILKATDILRILLKAGFLIVRRKGSYVRLKHILDKTKIVTIPVHAKDIPVKTLKSILKQAQLTAEEFLKLRRK